MITKEKLKELEKVAISNAKLAEVSDEELAQISGGGEAENGIFLCEYEPNIMLYRVLLNKYLLKDTLTGNERIVENASDLEDAAYELKALR